MRCHVELDVDVAHDEGEVTGVWLNGSFFSDDLEITEYLSDYAIQSITAQVNEQLKAEAEMEQSRAEDAADTYRQMRIDEQEAGG